MTPHVGNAGRVRPMTARDAAEVGRVSAGCFGANGWTPSEFREVLRADGTFGVVADPGYHLAGFLIARTVPAIDPDAGELHLLLVAVDPAYRLRGIARRLVSAAWVTPSGILGRFVAAVPEANLPAQKLLRSCGFRAVAVERRAFADGTAAYRFEKRAG